MVMGRMVCRGVGALAACNGAATESLRVLDGDPGVAWWLAPMKPGTPPIVAAAPREKRN